MSQSVFTREDTLFGVCFALGADFGFDPTWLRSAFACLFFWSPPAAGAIYGLLGMVVAVSRWLVPETADAEAGPAETAPEASEPEDWSQDELPLAA